MKKFFLGLFIGIILGILLFGAFLFMGGAEYIVEFGKKAEEVGLKLGDYTKDMKASAERADNGLSKVKAQAGSTRELMKDTLERARGVVGGPVEDLEE